MSLASRDLFKSISESEALNYQYQREGLMMLYKTNACQDEEEHLAEIGREYGLEIDVLNSAQLRNHEDQLEADVLGGVWYKSDAHIIPTNFMEEMTELLLKRGVQFDYNKRIDSIVKENGRIKAIRSLDEEYEADEYIVCSGSWSQEIVKALQINLPVQAGKGYHLHIPTVRLQLKTPSIVCEAKVAMTPMLNDLRISGTMEFAGLDLSINKNRVEGIKNSVEKYFKKFDRNLFEGLTPWAGLRPVSPDGLPYIGRNKKFSNLSFNTGHAMMGLSLAPISGKMISDVITKGTCEMNIDLLSPDRFQ